MSDVIDNGLPVDEDQHLNALEERSQQLKVLHINTQSMTSTFDSLLMTIDRYSFDIITMSETWLNENKLRLQHVTIPGYVQVFNHRDQIKGGGVGAYVKESIDFKRRTDIEKRYPSMEHLWIEIKGRNKRSNLLLGIVYRSDSVMVCSDWLGLFESLLSDLTVAWDGMLLVTGDINLDLFCPNKPPVHKYLDILSTLNLTQQVTKATRTTLHSETLIDHIITNMPRQVTFTEVLPCPHISEHDAPYVCINVRVTHFIPRYKYIRDKRNLELDALKQDFAQLPLNLVFSTDEPEMQLDLLNKLIRECIDRHAPLRRTKVTRPPAPWMKDLDIQQLQRESHTLRKKARKGKSDAIWSMYRDKRNELKHNISKTKRDFYNKALSSTKPKKVWKVINKILHPNPQPLRFNPDKLNAHFASTAQHVTGATATSQDNIRRLINSLPEDGPSAFALSPVSCGQVLLQLKKLRSDCSCGPDGIPVKFTKIVADHLASPLTHILNNFMLGECSRLLGKSPA